MSALVLGTSWRLYAPSRLRRWTSTIRPPPIQRCRRLLASPHLRVRAAIVDVAEVVRPRWRHVVILVDHREADPFRDSRRAVEETIRLIGDRPGGPAVVICSTIGREALTRPDQLRGSREALASDHQQVLGAARVYHRLRQSGVGGERVECKD